MKKISKAIVVTTWAHIALKDFFIAFYLDDKFPWYSTFFCHQGLEKICKAYLLGTIAAEFESLPFTEAKTKINKLAKDKKRMGHNLMEILEKLISINVLNNSFLTKEYAEYAGVSRPR